MIKLSFAVTTRQIHGHMTKCSTRWMIWITDQLPANLPNGCHISILQPLCLPELPGEIAPTWTPPFFAEILTFNHSISIHHQLVTHSETTSMQRSRLSATGSMSQNFPPILVPLISQLWFVFSELVCGPWLLFRLEWSWSGLKIFEGATPFFKKWWPRGHGNDLTVKNRPVQTICTKNLKKTWKQL